MRYQRNHNRVRLDQSLFISAGYCQAKQRPVLATPRLRRSTSVLKQVTRPERTSLAHRRNGLPIALAQSIRRASESENDDSFSSHPLFDFGSVDSPFMRGSRNCAQAQPLQQALIRRHSVVLRRQQSVTVEN